MVSCENVLTTESQLAHVQGVIALLMLQHSNETGNTKNPRALLQVCFIVVRI